jgi:hypothetical protein
MDRESKTVKSKEPQMPKFKKESLEYLQKEDIGRKKKNKSSFFSPVETHSLSREDEKKILDENYLLEDMVNMANTVNDFKNFKDMKTMTISQPITGSNSKNQYKEMSMKRQEQKIKKIKEQLYSKCSFIDHLKKWEENYGSKDKEYELDINVDLDSSNLDPDRFSVDTIEDVDEDTGRVYKTRILFCNNRPVPKWAENMKIVKAVSNFQKDNLKPRDVFGKFRPVKNLDLKEILNDYNTKYDIRGDSFYH